MLKEKLKQLNVKKSNSFDLKKYFRITDISTFSLIIFSIIVLAVSVRGNFGSPDEFTLSTPKWTETGPLELSPERGRYALTYSIVENGSFEFSLPIAKFATPDLGYTNGKYVSLFPPGVSLLIIPGYIIGKYFGVAQLGTYAIISIFGLLNLLLVRRISLEIGANKIAANLAALLFLFATPSFTYAVSLFQHHISTLLILLALLFLIKWDDIPSLFMIWFLSAFSIIVDFPNFFMMFPIGVFALSEIIYSKSEKKNIVVNIDLKKAISLTGVIIPFVFFLLINQASYGNPLQLAGTVTQVKVITEDGKPGVPDKLNPDLIVDDLKEEDRNAAVFLNSRNLLNGFYIHTLSPDRGLVVYTPIVLLGFVGLYLAYKQNKNLSALFVAIMGTNFVLYSLWGDPWGGWAFGSRYLIPSYAILAILISLVLTRYKKAKTMLVIVGLLFTYSTSVNVAGAITSSANPPEIAVLSLEQITNKEEKYTFERNFDELFVSNISKSFVYRTLAKDHMSAAQFYWLITSSLIIYFNTSLVVLNRKKND